MTPSGAGPCSTRPWGTPTSATWRRPSSRPGWSPASGANGSAPLPHRRGRRPHRRGRRPRRRGRDRHSPVAECRAQPEAGRLNKNIAVIRQIAARVESVRRNDQALLLATTAYDRIKQLGRLTHPEYVYPEVRCALLSALNRSPRLDRYMFTGRGKEPVLVVALSPDGRLLATVTPSGRIEGGGQGRGGHETATSSASGVSATGTAGSRNPWRSSKNTGGGCSAWPSIMTGHGWPPGAGYRYRRPRGPARGRHQAGKRKGRAARSSSGT